MTPKQQFRDKMIELWSGSLTRAQIVKRFGRSYALAFGRIFSERRLNEIWADARAAGKLIGDRPCFIQAPPIDADAAGCAIDAAADLELDRQIDRSERRFESADVMNIRATTDSLAALKAAHPELDRPLEYVVTHGGSFKPLPHPMVARELWYRPSKTSSKPETVA